MSIANNIWEYIKNGKKKDLAPKGYCPNCWGNQEYGGQFFEAVRNHGIDINTDNPDIGWIQDYAEKHLAGIKLEDHGDEYVCPTCKITYRPLK